MKTSPLAQQRACVILRVQKGELTATQGAKLLGISRKTYYVWEKRGLSGLIAHLDPKEPGRPRQSFDPEKEALRKKVTELEAALALAKEVESVRLVLSDLNQLRGRSAKDQTKKKPH